MIDPTANLQAQAALLDGSNPRQLRLLRIALYSHLGARRPGRPDWGRYPDATRAYLDWLQQSGPWLVYTGEAH